MNASATPLAQQATPPGPLKPKAGGSNQSAYADQKSCPLCWMRIMTFNVASLGPYFDKMERMPFEVFDQIRIMIGCAKQILPQLLDMSRENGTRPKLDAKGKIVLDDLGNPVPDCVGCAYFEKRRGQNVPANEPPIKILPDAKGM